MFHESSKFLQNVAEVRCQIWVQQMAVSFHLFVQLLVLSLEEENQDDSNNDAGGRDSHTEPESQRVMRRLIAKVGVGAGNRCYQQEGHGVVRIHSLAKDASVIWKAMAMLRLPRLSLLFAGNQLWTHI